MSGMNVIDPQDRLRRIVENALDGCSYESSHEEEDGHILIIEAKRADGRCVHLRFRGVREADASEAPAPGSDIKLRGVGSAAKFSLLGVLLPGLRKDAFGNCRVKIEAGNARLDIVCQDAEWWEEMMPGDSGRHN
jgi:hypothetical protein